jgi:uncharacterized membrane protein
MSTVLAIANIFDKEGIHWVLRWWHVVFGVAWIGLLYYFNFVQVPSFPTMEAAHRNGAIDKLVPRALWYFRWAALATAVTGLAMLGLFASDIYKGGYGHIIYAGSLIGLVMLANVWLIIWPNQQVVIANARGLLEGKPAKPETAAAGRKALLASRTNAIFSISMLMFMTGAQNWLGISYDTSKSAIVWWILVLIVVVVLELNALGIIGGLEGPLTKPLANHKNVAHIGVPVAIVLAVAWMVLCT